MDELQKQAEIVKQRLHYHFAKIGGGWNIEGMNAPFMKEFLNEIERLCALFDVSGSLPLTKENVIKCLKKRNKDAFDNLYQVYEYKEILKAIDIIERLML